MAFGTSKLLLWSFVVVVVVFLVIRIQKEKLKKMTVTLYELSYL